MGTLRIVAETFEISAVKYILKMPFSVKCKSFFIMNKLKMRNWLENRAFGKK